MCGRTPPVVERLAIASQSPKHETFSIIVKLSKISSCKFIISKLSLSTHPLASEIVTPCQPAQRVPVIFEVSPASHM